MKQGNLPGVDDPRDLRNIQRAIDRACLLATRNISLEDGLVTRSAWMKLVRTNLKGFRISDKRLRQQFADVYQRDIQRGLRARWGSAAIEYRMDLDDVVVQAYALVPVSAAKAAGLTIQPPTNLENKRAYFADDDVGQEAADGRIKRTGQGLSDEDGAARD